MAQQWREWSVTLTREAEPPTLLAVHARTKHAALLVLRYVIDAEARAQGDDPHGDPS